MGGMSTLTATIQSNLAEVREGIAAACRRNGRDPDDVTLVAVTKYAQPEWVRELAALGVTDLGESRPQQLLQRAGEFGDPVRWHLVGHLQRNKVRKVLPVAALIHSVDSVRLLSAVDRIAEEEGLTPRVLLEVNVSGEAAKDGFAPQELIEQWEEILAVKHVRIDGLMTMAPFADEPENSRRYFRELCRLRDSLRDRSPARLPLPELSMGMSRDFEVAVEEGATLVRIGRRLFAGLPS